MANDPVKAAVRAELERLGPQIVADAALVCGDPYPPASAPGAAPRRRTGRLSGGFGYRVVDGPKGPQLQITNSAPYAGYVNEGTSRTAARPYAKIIADKWGPEIARRTAEAAARGAAASRADAPGASVGGGVRGFVGRAASAVGAGFRRLFG